MAALRALLKPKIVKKRTKKFIQHQADWYVKIKYNWQKPRGTDIRVRRRFKGQILLPNTGYGSRYRSNQKIKHTQWFLEVSSYSTTSRSLTCYRRATNFTAQRLLTMSPPRTAKPLRDGAAQLGIRVPNPNAWLHSKENE
ncbi:unnamed protein product [Gulo gulo]|uniref:60S ribosomal protein L32 n=1 Tax=Gulo gulo TaxID=48420 RepID=A0A9X9LBU1_GULGU|nr:unnamed protein product [Gulo gulo]